MIQLKQLSGSVIDLMLSHKFIYHYHRQGSFAQYILDNEINNGQWFDEILLTIPEDAVIIDVGMNVGLWSLYLEAKHRKFFCIEPCSYHILVAKDLFEKFGYNAKIYEGVLYSKDGMVSFAEAPENTTSNRVNESGVKKVESRKLKTFLEENGIEKVDLLKLDCEGSEFQIFMEDKTIGEALQKVNTIFVETHVADGYMTIEQRDAMIEKIKGFGFNCMKAKRDGSYYFTKQ